MWSASITSVIGSTYTSISFLKTLHPSLLKWQRPLMVSFIAISANVFILNGQPVQTLVFVGLLNGFILPFALGIVLVAAYRKDLVGDYKHPWWLSLFGIIVVMATLWFGIYTAWQKL
jgi:Mn2+/Fe2+ NRAMP family transporter